jgi:MFS family permease
VLALLAFAAGFVVRPIGALVFGRLGDLIGRKYTFLVTIVVMGLSTFTVGLSAQLRRHRRGRAGVPGRPAPVAGAGAGR